MSLFTSERGRERPLGLIYIFSLGSVRRDVASSTSWAGLQTLVNWIPELGSGGSIPQASLGSVGVSQISCVTPSVVSTTGGADLTTLASMARVSCSMSSLMGTSCGIQIRHSLTGSAEPSCGIPLLLNLPPGRCPSCLIGSGGPLASP